MTAPAMPGLNLPVGLKARLTLRAVRLPVKTFLREKALFFMVYIPFNQCFIK
jgi:hypothetical protein